jgi:hypothetical protein
MEQEITDGKPTTNQGALVEQLAEEAAAVALLPVVTVLAIVPVIARLAISGLGISGLWITRLWITGLGVTRLAVPGLGIAGWCRCVTALARRRWGRGRCVGPGARARSRLLGVPVGLCFEEFFQLTAIEENAPALGALVHRDAAAFVHSHFAVALRTGHLHPATVLGCVTE